MHDRVYIFGCGGHARVVASLVAARDVVFIDRFEVPVGGLTDEQFFAQAAAFRAHPVYLGVGSNETRRALFNRLHEVGIAPTTCIAPNAFIAADAKIGAGTVICPGAVVNAGARLGSGVIINTLSSVDHDCTVGDWSQIAAGVTLGGGVSLGHGCLLGLKCAISPGVILGDGVQVMAGSYVAQDFSEPVVVGGNPARAVKKL